MAKKKALPSITWQDKCTQFFRKPVTQLILLVVLSCIYWTNYSANFDRK